MMPAVKMFDPVMGVDVHMVNIPSPAGPIPTPIPHPFVGMIFDPMELAPMIGAKVWVQGMPKGTAGSEGKAIPPHIPMGAGFVPPLPGNDCEIFLGSATVLFEDAPASFTALTVRSCGMGGMKLPTSVVMAIPAGLPVLIGGPPVPNMMGMALKALQKMGMKAMGNLIRKFQKNSKFFKRVSVVLRRKAKKICKKLGVPKSVQNKISKGICTVTGHPVDVATGKVFTDNIDFELPGPIPLVWERTWFSTSVYDGPLGRGWHHSCDWALGTDLGVVAVRMGDGRSVEFEPLKEGEERFNRLEKLTLVRSNNGYAIRTRDGLLYKFESDAESNSDIRKLIAIEDRTGSAIRFMYNREGLLVKIIDSAGRELIIDSDMHGRIVRIRAPHHETDLADFPVISYRYDDMNDLVEAIDPHQKSWHFTYANHLLKKETNRNGLSFYFDYDGATHEARCIRTWGDNGIYDHKITYNTLDKTTTVENSLGHKTVYHIADSGLVTKTIDSLGRESRTDFNDFNEPEREFDELGMMTAYAFDDRGNAVAIVNPDGSTLAIKYNTFDEPLEATDPAGGSWKWEYDNKGRLLKRVDPLGRETLFGYTGPFISSVTDPTGAVTALSVDKQGNLTSMITPDSGKSLWEYDRLGRVFRSTDPRGNQSSISYDWLGRITYVREPDGNMRSLEYDGEGNVVHAIDKQYDVTFEYSGMNRMVARAQNKTRVEFVYDTEERLTAIRNEHGSVYGFELDLSGDVTVESGFDGVRRVYERDAKGRVTKVTRASGLSTRYHYDALDRVVALEHSDGATESYEYRADGELLSAVNGAHRVTFERDQLGRVTKELQDGRWVESGYDALDMRISLRSSMGAFQTIERDAMGDVKRIAYRTDEKQEQPLWESKFTRDIMGLELERSLPGGIRSRWERDRLGRPKRHSITSLKGYTRTRDYVWDVNDRLRQIIDSLNGPIIFQHDNFGNLSGALYRDGSELLRMPDSVGNLFRTRDRSDRKYGRAGQLVESLGKEGWTRYEYDAEGNLIKKILPSGKAWRYEWNAAGMMARVIRPDETVVEFSYDPLGRRISKTFGRSTTRWVWDGNTMLHEWVEVRPGIDKPASPTSFPLDNNAAAKNREEMLAGRPANGPPPEPITWLFEPESFAPMAKIQGEERHSIVTDHLGTPVAMFNDRGEQSWAADLDIYGRVIDKTVKGNAVDCPFRFPGQYEDEETGLYYNRFRYYDPESGEYVSQDPIGLAGGMGLYSYCFDTILSLDPFGLASCGVQPKKFKTPFKPLSAKEKRVLNSKLKSRTITRQEYQHLQWDKRFSNRRNRGVDRFWSDERKKLRTGQPGTRNWSPQQKSDILAGRTPTHAGSPIEGHHKYNALDHPQLADRGDNIFPATRTEHQNKWHGGNWQNDTSGSPLNPSFPDEF
jgi:RHS repeat-associated protein